MGNLTKNTITRGAVVALALSAGAATTANAAVTNQVGADRYATANTKILGLWPAGSTTAILAAGEGHDVDALTVAPLAKMKKAPIILVDTKKSATEIANQFAAYTTVYIANGNGVVTDAVKAALEAKGIKVTRLGGADRYATALAIAKEVGTANSFVVTNGEVGAADALSIASIAAAKGMPIFLTNGTSFDEATTTWIKGLNATSSYVLGGPTLVAEALKTTLPTATRLYGADRYATNAAVLNQFKSDAAIKTDKVYLAGGETANLIDALTAAPLAGLTGSPIVFVAPTGLTADAKTYLTSVVTSGTDLELLGGAGAAANTAVTSIQANASVGVSSVSAIAANSIKVTFSAPVDTTKAVLTVKMGTVVTNIKSVTWNAAKTEATLVGYGSFAAGDYTVTASGIDITKNSATVTIAAQKVVSITFTGTRAVLTAAGAVTAKASYVIKDQYGTDVTSTYEAGFTASATGTTGTSKSGGVLTMTFLASPAVDTAIVVTLVDPATGVVGTTTLKVALASAADNITLSALKNVDNKVLRTDSVVTTDLFQYDVTALDQYGTAVTTSAALANDFIVLYSNASLTSSFVSSTSTAPAKLKITGIPTTAGTYTITLVSKTSGKSLVVPIVVADAVSVATFTMSNPATTPVKGETTNIPFVAVDQYGNAVTKYADLNGKITFTVADVSALPANRATVGLVNNPVDGTALLQVVVPKANTAPTIIATSIVNGKTSTSQLNLTLNAVAVPTTIQSLSATVAKKLVIGATSTIKDTDFVINDQYGRAMTLPAGYTIDLVSATPANVTVGASIAPAGSVLLTGIAAGSSIVTATIVNSGTPVANSGIDFTAATVAKADITSYGIDTAAKVFAPGVYAAGQNAAYASAYTVYGMTAAGDKVALDQSTSGLDLVTVSSTNANLNTTRLAAGEVYATALTTAGTDETATIVAVVNGANGIVTVTKTVTLTDKAPVGGTIAVKATSGDYVSFASGVAVMTAGKVDAMDTKIVSSHVQYTTANVASVYFEILDQYGVASAAVKPSYYTLKATDAAGTGSATGTYSINATTGAISATGAATGDTITITAIAADGKVSTAKIIVQ